MRSDYGLYVVAVICFIIAGIFLTQYTDPMGMAAIAIFLILGAILALAGYAVRPKVPVSAISTAPQTLPEPSAPAVLPPVEEKVEEPQVTPPPQEEQAPPEPTPAVEEAPAVSPEPVKAEEEKPPPAEKRARRPRKKKTATA